MEIIQAQSDAEIAACYPVMRELRPHLAEDEFVTRVRRQALGGYSLACVREAGCCVAVAGYRFGESLSWGRYLYVDDLVTLSSGRSRGYGGRLLAVLERHARANGCEQMHLASGIQRTDAHRFYEREGMQAVAYHFHKALA